jgi:hypothetical protein
LRRPRGISLIELLISATLMGLCLSAVHMLVKAGNNYLRVSQAKHDLQSQALLSLAWLQRELGESDPESYKTLSTPYQGVIFASPRDDSGQVQYDLGRMLWPKFICYYVKDQNLVRKVKSVAPPFPYPPPAPGVDTVAGDASLTIRTLAKHVTLFEVSGTQIPINIKLELTMEPNLGKAYAIQVKSQVFPRN